VNDDNHRAFFSRDSEFPSEEKNFTIIEVSPGLWKIQNARSGNYLAQHAFNMGKQSDYKGSGTYGLAGFKE